MLDALVLLQIGRVTMFHQSETNRRYVRLAGYIVRHRAFVILLNFTIGNKKRHKSHEKYRVKETIKMSPTPT